MGRDLSALARELGRQDCVALLVLAGSSRDPDLAPFVGPVHLGRCLLVAGVAGRPRLGYLTEMEREEAAASGCEALGPTALGVTPALAAGAEERSLWSAAVRSLVPPVPPGGAGLALAGHLGAGLVAGLAEGLRAVGWRLADGTDVVRRWRRRKSPPEVEAVRAAASGAVAALRATAGLLASAGERDGVLWQGGERLRAAHLRAAIARTLAAHRLEQPEGNIVAAGEAAGVPHSQGEDERILRPGEAVVVDVFPRGRLYADCTRTLCVGEPPPALARAHAAVLEALTVARREVREGAEAWELQRRTCEILAARGYPTILEEPAVRRGYVHNLGHGVGYELHEVPSFRRAAGEDGRLARGDVFTLEPGLYEPGEGWGVRLEDLFWLGPQGAENLTPLPYELDPRAWGA